MGSSSGPVIGYDVDPGDFEGLVEMGRKLAGADAALMGDDELVAMTVAVEQLRSSVETACGHLLAELDSRGVCAERYGLDTKRWVACAAGVSPTGVGLRLKTGRVAHDHLDVMDAVASTGPASMDSAGCPDAHGDSRVGLSSDHARVVASVLNCRNREGLVALQDEIVALAQGATFERFCAEVRGIAAMLDADGPQPNDASVNALSISGSMNGLTSMDATFSSDLGLVVSSAIDDKADELFRAFVVDKEVSDDMRVPNRRCLRALALVELVRIAVGTAPGARRAPRAEVALVVHDHEVTSHDGQPISRAALDVWGCDPEIWVAVVDRMGVVTDMGHRRRLASVAQRKVIAVRDGGCVFPGCDAPITWCDMHHVEPWQTGGATDAANLVALCRRHHGIAHRDGWSLDICEGQHVTWTSPSGDSFAGQRHGRVARPPGSG